MLDNKYQLTGQLPFEENSQIVAIRCERNSVVPTMFCIRLHMPRVDQNRLASNFVGEGEHERAAVTLVL